MNSLSSGVASAPEQLRPLLNPPARAFAAARPSVLRLLPRPLPSAAVRRHLLTSSDDPIGIERRFKTTPPPPVHWRFGMVPEGKTHHLKMDNDERSKNWCPQCAPELHHVEIIAKTFMNEAQEKSEAMIATSEAVGEAVEQALTQASELMNQHAVQAAKDALMKARTLASEYLNHSLTEHLSWLSEALEFVGARALMEAISEAQALVSESLNHLLRALALASECLHECGARATAEALLREAQTLTSESLHKLLKAVTLVSGFLRLGDRDATEALSLVLTDISECLREHGRVKAANQRVAEILNALAN